MNKIKKYKNIVIDVFLNLVSNLVVMVVIQLLIFPFIARESTPKVFGQIIALYGFKNVIVLFLGNTLGNIRLLNQKRILDYSLLIFVINILSALLILVLSFVYSKEISLIDTFIFACSTVLFNNRMYASVYYRINLKYNELLYQNILIVIGYFLGLLIFEKTGLWATIFLCGEILGIFYMAMVKNNILYETFKLKKKVDTELLQQFSTLSISNGISSFLNYLDRFIISPLLGATSMAVFYAASSVSKIITMIITPMTNVLLSYLTKSERKVNQKQLLNIFIFSSVLITPIYFLLNSLSEFMVNLLYRDLAKEAIKLIPIISIGILIGVLTNLLNPFLLKIFYVKYQGMIQALYGSIYLILSFSLSSCYGLEGFSLAFSISMGFKLMLQLLVILFGTEQEGKKFQ